VIEPVVVDLQEHDALTVAFTDVEDVTAGSHVIIEVKRGWSPPGEEQERRCEAPLVARTRHAVARRFDLGRRRVRGPAPDR